MYLDEIHYLIFFMIFDDFEVIQKTNEYTRKAADTVCM